jgi:hypothetical protein
MRKLISKSLLHSFLCLAAVLPTMDALAADRRANQKPIWLVVTRPAFVQAVKPLEQKRAEEGFETIVSTQSIAEAIAGLNRQPAFLLLVGDCQPGEEEQPWHIPTQTRKLYQWDAFQRKDFASDVLWGDFDGDLVPDIPVGRIPVRTPQQLKLVVNKILAFESKQPGPDDLRLPVWAGSASYDNPTLNMMATHLLVGSVKTSVPLWVQPWLMSADPSHALCGWLPNQGAMFTTQFKQGGLAAVLIGHGWDTSFAVMGSQNLEYSAEDAAKALATGDPGPAMVIIACHTGRFAERKDCLAESLLLMPAGPVAVIASTTASHELTNYFAAQTLSRKLGQKNKRLGDIWLATQQEAVKMRDIIMERVLCNASERADMPKMRRDHILMYALLGDPATRMHLPDPLDATVEYSAGTWRWDARKPQGATKLYVSFRPPAENLPQRAVKIDKETARKLFEQANDSFAFKPVVELSAEAPWEGAISEQGTLRLVATGPGQIYAAAFELKPTNPTTQPK